MRKELYTCDVCDREVTCNDDFAIRMPAMWRIGHAEMEQVQRFNLCEKCAAQARELLDVGWKATFAEMLKKHEEE